MAEIILSALMASVEKEQSRGRFSGPPDEGAHHKDEWLLSLRTPGLMGWFNWVELNLSPGRNGDREKIYAVDL